MFINSVSTVSWVVTEIPKCRLMLANDVSARLSNETDDPELTPAPSHVKSATSRTLSVVAGADPALR